MTAKNKRIKAKGSAGNTSTNDPDPTKTLDRQLPKSGQPFSKAQLAAIVFLMTGASKIRSFHLALKESDGATCMLYLNSDETCSHPDFKSLIQVKYFSGISLAALVATFAVQMWVSEYYLMKFMSGLCICPLLLIMLAVTLIGFGPDDARLTNSGFLELCSTATVLFGMVRPASFDALPFFLPSSSPVSVKYLSPQAAGLSALALGTVWEVARVFLSSSSNGLQNALLETDSPFPLPARNLVYFWAIDKFAMLLLYAFALYHLPMFKQGSVLLAAAFIKIGEYAYQLPNMHNPWQEQGAVEQLTLGLAVLSAVAWFAPHVSLD